MIRIHGGCFRSRQLVTPKGTITRPTSSQLRQAVFNICQQEIQDASFLDICAGSGAMGFEALSHGAKECGFIEHNRNAIFAIKENIQILQVEDKATLYYGDALHVLANLEAEKKRYDIAYFDPPYTNKGQALSPLATSIITYLDQVKELLPSGSYLFVEESIFADLSKLLLKQLDLKSVRRFGDSQLFFFIKRARLD